MTPELYHIFLKTVILFSRPLSVAHEKGSCCSISRDGSTDSNTRIDVILEEEGYPDESPP